MSTWDANNDAVLAMVRQVEGETLVGLFNFSGKPQAVHLNGSQHILEPLDAELEPYEAKLIRR